MRDKILAALAGSAIIMAPNAGAAEFDWGTFDTTVSYGAQWRVEDRDPRLIGKANLNPAVAAFPPAQFVAAPGAFSVNGDDGNLNYDKGDVFASVLKVNHDLKLNLTENIGFFGRAFYFTDFKTYHNTDLNPEARRRAGYGGDLLDAFFYGDWILGESGTPFSLRVGKQVVSWGESTFIQGGINVVNPVDVGRIRQPGSELKEALLPVNSVWTSFGITQNVSVELLALAQWKDVKVDPPGTYFSTADFIGSGADTVMLGFGQFTQAQAPALAVGRAPTQEASDSGQYGGAVRWFLPSWDTELGFFYLRYHSRLPVLTGIAVTSAAPNSAQYFTEFPEDIDLYGISFNTVVSGIALQGEYSYRPNQPLQIDDVELLFAALSPLNALLPNSPFLSQLGTFLPGEVIPGYVEHKVGQLQFTGTWLAGQGNPFGAQQMVLLGEFGATKVFDLPAQSVLRYEGPGTYTGGGADRTSGDLRNPLTQADGFADDFSWGYRLVTRLDYLNALGAWNVSPRLAFAHDVSGTTPGPGGNFVEGRKSATLGFNFNYLERLSVDMSYTMFSGGGTFNLISDRDFAAIDFKYSF